MQVVFHFDPFQLYPVISMPPNLLLKDILYPYLGFPTVLWSPPPGRCPQCWLPLQSFIRTIPKMCSWALLIGIGSPYLFPGPTKNAWSQKAKCWLSFWSQKSLPYRGLHKWTTKAGQDVILHHFPDTIRQGTWPTPSLTPSLRLAALKCLGALCCQEPAIKQVPDCTKTWE